MKKNNPLLITVPLILITLGGAIYVLSIGSALFIPFIVAVFLSFLILSLSHFYDNKGVPKYVSFVFSLCTIVGIIYLITQIIDSNIDGIIKWAPQYQERLVAVAGNMAQKYSLDREVVTNLILEKINIPQIISYSALTITSIVKNTGMILLFTVFILLESTAFEKKLIMITGGENSSFFKITEQIKKDMKSYFLIKSIASITVGLLSAIVLFIFWIDFLFFWAFVIFLFNYIPSIGSIIAVTFPVIFSLIQYESPSLTIIFLICMVSAQVLVWNFLEPRLMWNKLNLSPLVILISLIFWGMLWGPIGMLLSVPIMVMINIVLAHIPATRPIAILLSEKWMIKFSNGDRSKSMNLKKLKKLLK